MFSFYGYFVLKNIRSYLFTMLTSVILWILTSLSVKGQIIQVACLNSMRTAC